MSKGLPSLDLLVEAMRSPTLSAQLAFRKLGPDPGRSWPGSREPTQAAGFSFEAGTLAESFPKG